MPERAPLKTVETAFEIVEALWRHHGAGVSELADEVGMPKSTVHDYVRTLRASGYAINSNGEYRLSTKFLQIGGRLKHRMALFHAAKPELERVAEQTGETTALMIEENGFAVILHKEMGEGALNLGEYPGMHTPIHAHAAGKALLSLSTDSRIDDIVDRRGLPQVTDHTITDREELFEQVETIREQGYAFDVDQQVIGMGVVSAPISGVATGPAALAIVCPTHRMRDEAYVNELAETAMQTTNVITINMTYGVGD